VDSQNGNVSLTGAHASIALDGANQVWFASYNGGGGGESYQQVLFQVNGSNTAVLSTSQTDGSTTNGAADGYVAWDASSGYPNPISQQPAGVDLPAVDSSGNLWLAAGGTSGGSLSEFIGVGVPAYTPLGAALVGGGPGTRP
jgi:hypothetical protein